MKIYQVGGAVRDRLLNIKTHDRDWVVVGSTTYEMLAQGFQQVGKDFPVFLHPKTNEEFALARTERKVGHGYTGFICDSSQSVTLEDDLRRRDLTINAIAEDEQGNIVDPFNGQADIASKTLRHVSNAFTEDPLRVLRVARFAARFYHLGFTVAPETLLLMQEITAQGELDHLVPERIWKELSRALMESNPEIFINVLRECGALKIVFPEIDALFGVPQPEKHHPEIDTGEHILLGLRYAAENNFSSRVRFAVLLHDLGKALTPKAELPKHIAHEERGIKPINALCNRIKVPNEFKELALLACKYHTHCHRALELKCTTMLKTLEGLDAFRRPERFEEFLLCCQADACGRTGRQNSPYPQADYFRRARQVAHAIDINLLLDKGLQGAALGEAIREARLDAIKQINPG